jgi:hypothetical protein
MFKSSKAVAKPIYRNVKGSPFKIWDLAQVLEKQFNDATFDSSFCNKIGRIIYFEYSCGCGQRYPFDPLIGIEFQDGKIEEFWKEEIKII